MCTSLLNNLLDMHSVVSDEEVAEFLTDTQWESFEDIGADGDEEDKVLVQVCS